MSFRDDKKKQQKSLLMMLLISIANEAKDNTQKKYLLNFR